MWQNARTTASAPPETVCSSNNFQNQPSFIEHTAFNNNRDNELRPFFGKGFATEAANACLSYGFEHLAFTKIVSFTAAVNVNSEKLMKRIGMKYISDFDHPKIEKNSPLCRHVLYAIEKNHFTT